MLVKVKEKFEKTRYDKNDDKSKKYILRGQGNVRYHDRVLSHKKKPINFTTEVLYKKAYDISRKRSHNLTKNKKIINS